MAMADDIPNPRWDRMKPHHVIIAIGVIWILLALIWMPATAFTIDGYLSMAMADAMARDGSLFVTNGFTENPTPALIPPLFVPHDGQLAPQYPGGWGVFAAPAWALGGARGMMVFNAGLGAATIWLVFATARRLLGDTQTALQAALLFGAASFAVDYALGMWTHAAALFASALAVYAIVRADQTARERWALIAGLALGVGVNVRVDVVFPAAAILIWTLAATERPYRMAGLVMLGLAPGVACATLINLYKFGVASPLSYGGGGGRASMRYFAHLLPLVAVGAAGVVLLGLTPVRAALRRPAIIALCAALGVAAVLVIGAAQDLVVRMIGGAWSLMVDFQTYSAESAGLGVDEHGRLTAFGHIKRALFQSAPYLVAGLAALPLLFTPGRGRQVWLLLLITGATIAPFAYGAWFGGMANSMRYFLHCLPALTILAALGMVRLGVTTQAVMAAVAVGGLLALMAHLFGDALDALSPWWSIRTPNFVMATCAALIVLKLATGDRAPRWALAGARFSALAGVSLAVGIAWGADLRASYGVRDLHARYAAAVGPLPDDALLATFRMQYFPMRLNRPPALTSPIRFADADIPDDFVTLAARSLAEDRPVYVQGVAAAQALIDRGVASAATPLLGVNEYSDLFRMRR